MRESYTERAPASVSVCMPYAYAGSQQDPLHVQRFSISDVQSKAGNPMYLPFERQLHTNQHSCASRLRPSARLGASTTQTLPVINNCVSMSSAAHHHTEDTFEPLSSSSHTFSGRQTSQGTCGSCCCFQNLLQTDLADLLSYVSYVYSLPLASLHVLQQAMLLLKLQSRCWFWRWCSVTDKCMHTSTLPQRPPASHLFFKAPGQRSIPHDM